MLRESQHSSGVWLDCVSLVFKCAVLLVLTLLGVRSQISD
uniref:Uncharacterized protein n=1 Tax=Anguilla anguilla TaxID=7936 RepID=A0A0E9SVN7_ANGAN